ncbi:MAG TPA: alpha/beta hydrolase [Verrucomicrobiae bacterium]|jgi:pimeloyl-ACP methyl ester carboxylesterase
MKTTSFTARNYRISIIRGITIFLLAIAFAASQGITTGEETKAATSFEGETVQWHGFDRYDFMMDESDLSITPFKQPQKEKFGVGQPPDGHRRCIVVVPKNPAPGNPWSWRGCYWDHQPQTEIELLKRGFHIVFITPDPDKTWDAWYAYLVEKHGLSSKPAFIGMSKGGYNEFVWATDHPDKVSCIYADNPAINRTSLLKLDGLASNDVPLLHVCGSIDPLFPNHTLAAESLYQSLGGRISVMIKEGFGHHPHSLHNPTPIADFIVASQTPIVDATPPFTGNKMRKTWFYGVKNDYRDFPSEKTRITCRGPLFTDRYRRYEFEMKGIQGSITIIAPKSEAPGKPWVYRTGFVDRNAAVDLALLAKGYYIVTGPVPYNADGPLKPDWDAVYQYLASVGFAAKPVMEGAGGAGGVVYAWAVQNPDKVSCVYTENPVLRGAMSVSSLVDHFEPLAKAGVPLINVCGGADPGINDNTRSLEAKYKSLGGKITVIVKEGQGHYPLAPTDASAVADLIVKNNP